MRHWIYNKTIYSDAEYILGHRHRVRVEVQLLPRSLVQSQEESGSGIGSTGESKVDQKGDDNVIVCRFELQRDNSVGTDNMTSSQQHGGSSQQQHASNAPDGHRPDSKLSPQQQTKIRYDIYCLNRHQVLDGNNHVDPEDKVLVPVSKVTEAKDAAERSASYVKQVVLNMDALDDKKKMDVDMVVALEIFGFQKM
ncbi:hypothetical protein BCR42DRAFT_404805 [Absidia repens]|uniref:Uncharacterized protein n=1 Tax=Absidia repens TaxID=90262 RepID=A0A1X2IWP0_9FUNG|nr:hypothetical protein BCR42DRAFT_404805 [Absidia repens]